jgi:hypothetical protein
MVGFETMAVGDEKGKNTSPTSCAYGRCGLAGNPSGVVLSRIHSTGNVKGMPILKERFLYLTSQKGENGEDTDEMSE